MAEPTITCPNCKTEIKLTESLAAPLVESIRRDVLQRVNWSSLMIRGANHAVQYPGNLSAPRTSNGPNARNKLRV